MAAPLRRGTSRTACVAAGPSAVRHGAACADRAARTASPTSGTSSEIVPLRVIAQATTMIPSSVRPEQDQRQTGEAAGRIAERRECVVSSAARPLAAIPAKRYRQPAGTTQRSDVGRGVVGDARAVSREHAREPGGAELRDEHERHSDRRERERETDELRPRACSRPSPARTRQDGDPDRLRADCDDEEDPVRGEEAVRLRRLCRTRGR